MLPLTTPIHQSTLNDLFHQCPWYVYRKWCLQIPPDFRSPKALRGTAVHNCLKIIGKLWPHFEKVNFQNLWTEAWDQAVNLNRQIFDYDESEIPIKWYPDEATQWPNIAQEGLNLVENFCYHCPAHEVLEIEVKVKFEIERRYRKPLHFEGIYDQIWKMPTGIVGIVDFKTNQQLPTDDLIINSYQFAIYAIGEIIRLGGDLSLMPEFMAWYHLRDNLPYQKNTTKDLPNEKYLLLRQWVKDNGTPGNGGYRYSFKVGQQKGPALYPYIMSGEYLETRKILLRKAAGLLKLSFPTPYINNASNQSGCAVCDMQYSCRKFIFGQYGEDIKQPQLVDLKKQIDTESAKKLAKYLED